jgi:hypothetical protein
MPPISGRASGTVTAGGMLRGRTPVEDHRAAYGLWVKREDLSCPPPGPPFSKARGVYARVASRPEGVIAVLDTRHSQAGWAVARACQVLGKECVNFYPEFKPARAAVAGEVSRRRTGRTQGGHVGGALERRQPAV